MQTDTLNIPDSNGQVYRLDVNEAIQAIATDQAGDVEPLDKYPYMVWKDTSTIPPVTKYRNAANTAWETAPSGVVTSNDITDATTAEQAATRLLQTTWFDGAG